MDTLRSRTAHASTFGQETNFSTDNIRQINVEAARLKAGMNLSANTVRHLNVPKTSRRGTHLSTGNTRYINVGASTSNRETNLHVNNRHKINTDDLSKDETKISMDSIQQENVRVATSRGDAFDLERNIVENESQNNAEIARTRQGANVSDCKLFTITGNRVENPTNKNKVRAHNALNIVTRRHNVNRCREPVKRVSANFAEQRNVFLTIGILLIVLNVSIVPLLVMPLVTFSTDKTLSKVTIVIISFMPLINSLINPIIYFIRVKTFREALLHSLSNLCRKLARFINR